MGELYFAPRPQLGHRYKDKYMCDIKYDNIYVIYAVYIMHIYIIYIYFYIIYIIYIHITFLIFIVLRISTYLQGLQTGRHIAI